MLSARLGLFFLFILEWSCLIRIIKTDKIIIMGAILMSLIVICIALYFKLISWRDEKREHKR